MSRRTEPGAGSSRQEDAPLVPGAAPVDAALAQLEVHVAGLSCVLCARRLEEYLRRQHGVESALVNPNTGRLRVRYRPHQVSPANLEVEIRRAGFTPRGASAHLRVSGMHCASCAAAVERALLRQAGVERVAVSLEIGDVHVDYLPQRIDPVKLPEAVTRLGYRAEVMREPGEGLFAVLRDAAAVASQGPPADAAPTPGVAAVAAAFRRRSLFERFRFILGRRRSS